VQDGGGQRRPFQHAGDADVLVPRMRAVADGAEIGFACPGRSTKLPSLTPPTEHSRNSTSTCRARPFASSNSSPVRAPRSITGRFHPPSTVSVTRGSFARRPASSASILATSAALLTLLSIRP
jgi:hypothetical protein